MSLIMELFEWVIEQRLHSYLEDIGFMNISQVSDRLSLLMTSFQAFPIRYGKFIHKNGID